MTDKIPFEIPSQWILLVFMLFLAFIYFLIGE